MALSTSLSSLSSLKSLHEEFNEYTNKSILTKDCNNFIDKSILSLNNDYSGNELRVDHNRLSNTSDNISEQNYINKEIDESISKNIEKSVADSNIKIIIMSDNDKKKNIHIKLLPKNRKIYTNFHKKELSNFAKSCDMLNIENCKRTRSTSASSLVWTEWIVQKAKESIFQKEISFKIKKELLEQEKKRLKEILIKRAKCDEKFKEWSQKYDEELIEKQKEKEELIKQELKKKEIKKEEIKLKADESYKEWIQKKKVEKKLKEDENRLEKEKFDIQKKIKEERNQEAFENWLKISKNRLKASCQSYAITCGRKIAYYDWGCCSQPSYKNPQKWICE